MEMKNAKESLATLNSNKSIGLRKFTPMIIQTKEELLEAMHQGKIKTSKYNLLSDKEKLFVELIVFGGYTGEQAVRAINPGTQNAAAIANRMMANMDVVETINELSIAKDKKFAAEIASTKSLALEKLKYIMVTTDDPALAASCAKTILDKSEFYAKQGEEKEDEQVGGIRFNIRVDNVNVTGEKSPKESEPVIIELTPEEVAKATGVDPSQVVDVGPGKKADINPETGLPFTLKYEGIDNYHDNGDEEDE